MSVLTEWALSPTAPPGRGPTARRPATLALTADVREVEKLYRFAVFNVLAHNRDDHSKNVSYPMDRTGHWTLAPAYKLTFSSGPGGQHSTMVMGDDNPTPERLLALAADAGIAADLARAIIDQTREALAYWPTLARAHGVAAGTVQLVSGRLGA